MTDRDKVIVGLKKAAEELARYAPMKVNGRCQMYIDGAIHLLKEQEPVMWSYDGYNSFVCSNCGLCVNDEVYYMMDKPISFCPGCGRKVKWNE